MSDGVRCPARTAALRCPWALSAPEYLAYHDEEWGRPVRGDAAIFERLCLEAFQSGLSWLTILRKRENFRAAFAGFDAAAVAAFGDQDVARLMADRGNRTQPREDQRGDHQRAGRGRASRRADRRWSGGTRAGPTPRRARWPTCRPPTPASKALAAELKGHGFTFTGPVTAYATMQACGIVNDHLADCVARDAD